MYDQYEKLAELYFAGERDDFSRLFELIHAPETRKNIPIRFLPRFSQVAFLVQMPHLDPETEVGKVKGSALTTEDKKELESRVVYAKHWLGAYAPEEYRFELQKEMPEAARGLSSKQKEALKKILAYVRECEALDGQELHTRLHGIKDEVDISPKDLFSAIYLSFLGKASGPKAGWLLSTLEKPFLEGRLEEVTA